MVYSSQGQQATPTPRDPAASDATEADNTKQNSSEQNKNTETAEKQSNSKDDLALTQKVRQAVMKDGSLSMNAKNVKIIAQDGKITLKGPVDSQQEKDTIGTEAGRKSLRAKTVSITSLKSKPGKSEARSFCKTLHLHQKRLKVMKRSALCLVDTEAQADAVVAKLRSAGFSDNDISVLFPIREAPAISLTKKQPRCRKVRRSAPVREVSLEAPLDYWPVSVPWPRSRL
jgi:hyperosmotically inducible protein